MTKRREPFTVHRALTTVASRLGWDGCAAICGVGERTMRYWSDPDAQTEIRLIDAMRLDRAFIEAGGDHAPFHQCYSLRLDMDALEGAAPVTSLSTLVAASAKETGEAVSALIGACAQTSDLHARRKALTEVEDAIRELTACAAALGRMAG